VALSPEDDIFIACSPRVVRRRLGSHNTENQNNNTASNAGPAGGGGGAGNSPDQLTLPSPGMMMKGV
jgi:hypothetical protein